MNTRYKPYIIRPFWKKCYFLQKNMVPYIFSWCTVPGTAYPDICMRLSVKTRLPFHEIHDTPLGQSFPISCLIFHDHSDFHRHHKTGNLANGWLIFLFSLTLFLYFLWLYNLNIIDLPVKARSDSSNKASYLAPEGNGNVWFVFRLGVDQLRFRFEFPFRFTLWVLCWLLQM